MKQVLKKVEEKLAGLNITKEEIQKIIKELEQEDLLTICNEGVLRSDTMPFYRNHHPCQLHCTWMPLR